MADEYDGIVLGTGNNALVLQAYLSRSGLKVVSLDRAAMPGGGLATEENPRFPGFPAQYPFLFSSRHHCDAVVPRPGARDSWRALISSPNSTWQ